MIHNVTMKTAPTVEPVSLDEVKTALRIDPNDTTEDDLISAYITAARQYCEDYQHRAFITQTWEMTMGRFPCGVIEVPKGKLQTVDAVTYKDATGNVVTLAEGNDYVYTTVGILGRISPAYGKSWPVFVRWPLDAVTIEFTCGYGDSPTDVPEKTRQAMKLLVAHWYANREPLVVGSISKELEFTLAAILGQDRIMLV